jgi:hypothetical protein
MKTINGKTYLSIEDYVISNPPLPINTQIKTKLGLLYVVGYSTVLDNYQFKSWKYCAKMYNKPVGSLNPVFELSESEIFN